MSLTLVRTPGLLLNRLKGSVLKIEGRELRLSNLDKVLYPAERFTKGQVIEYYLRIAPCLLPHLHTLQNAQDGNLPVRQSAQQ